MPAIVSWPKRIQPGISNQVMSHLDWLPTILAAVGEPKIKDKLEGYVANGKRYKVHLDGYNFLPYLTGAQATGPRKEFFYFTDGECYPPFELEIGKVCLHSSELWDLTFGGAIYTAKIACHIQSS